MRSIVLGLVFLFCFVVPGFAAGDEAVKENSGSVLKDAITETFEAVLQQGGAISRVEWQGMMDRAQARRSRGQRYVFVGLGVGVAGSVIAAAAGPDYYFDRGNGGLRAVGIMTALGGAGVFWYGIYNWVKGADEVDNLDREGRAKGYLTFAPTEDGALMVMNFTF